MHAPTLLKHARDVAREVLAPEYKGFGEPVTRFENGDEIYWRPLFEGDVGADHFDIALIARTHDRPKNAMASLLFTKEFIDDDESGTVIGHAIDQLRKQCEEHIAAA